MPLQRTVLLIFAALLPLSAVTGATITYSPSTANIPNPERGFHTTINPPATSGNVTTFEVSQAAWTPLLSETVLRENRISHGVTVHSMRLNLAMFRTANISQVFLDRIAADCATARRAGVKLILRFAYGWQGKRPDTTAEWIVTHIGQMQDVLTQNEDVICHFDAGFVGAWGEWHSSTSGLLSGQYGDNVNQSSRQVLDKLFAALPADRNITFRYIRTKPQYFDPTYSTNDSWWDYPQPIPASADAYTGTPRSRAANLNDSFMSDAFDGTYGYNNTNANANKNRISQENKHVVQSGESDPGLGQSSTLSTADRMRTEGKRMRWSLLNRNAGDNTSSIIQKWISEGSYPEIERSLGYRFSLNSATIPDAGQAGSSLPITLKIVNLGWATPFNPREFELIFRHRTTGAVTAVKLEADPRRWLPDSGEITLNLSPIVPSSMAAGEYALLLNLPDPSSSLRERPEYSIQLANQDIWEPATGYNSLGHTVVISTLFTYASWSTDFDWGTTPLADREPLADANANGIENLMEFAFNLSPTTPATLTPGTGTSGMPAVSVVTPETPMLQIEYLRRKNSGLTYTVKFSDDLVDWDNAVATPTPTTINADWERCVMPDTAGTGHTKRFAKVVVSEIP